MIGKFNITKLGPKDQILLGIPWLRAMNLSINWTTQTLSLFNTLKYIEIKESIKHSRQLNGLSQTPLIKEWVNSKLRKEPLPSSKFSTSIEEVPENIPSLLPTEDHECFDTKEDVWIAPAVHEISTYELDDGEFLVEYDTNGDFMRVITQYSSHPRWNVPIRTTAYEYLGMVIKPGCVEIDKAKTNGIRYWPTPTIVKEV